MGSFFPFSPACFFFVFLKALRNLYYFVTKYTFERQKRLYTYIIEKCRYWPPCPILDLEWKEIPDRCVTAI